MWTFDLQSVLLFAVATFLRLDSAAIDYAPAHFRVTSAAPEDLSSAAISWQNEPASPRVVWVCDEQHS
jgi:hypothetical protein